MRLSTAVALCCLCPIAFAADPAHASIRKDTNIPAEGLGTALETLAKDYDFQVLYRTEVVKDRRTQGAVGSLTSDEALVKVLSGTGLSYKYLDASTVTIVPVALATAGATTEQAQTSPNSAQDNSKEAGKNSSQDFRVAQTTAQQSQENVPVDRSAGQEAKKKSSQIEEVVVTGSRVPTLPGQQVVPVRSYSREDIESSGQSTIADFISTVPSVSVSSVDGPLAGRYADQTTVQLHGLPAGTTLVLLNGHRVEINNYGFFDLNNIPISAIERVEVLPVGASAVYGADALAGAVNIILRKDIQGIDATARYGAASGTNETDATLAAGKIWDEGGISIIGSYQHRSGLLGSQRSVTANPQYDTAATYGLGDLCSPGTVYSLTGNNLPGLQSTQAAIPRGIIGKPSLESFVATAGLVNHCGYYSDADVLAPSDREGLLASAHFELSNSVEVFAELLLSHESVDSRVGDVIQAINAFGYTVSASNPYNPFGEDVGISFTYPGLPYTYSRDTTFSRPLVGIRGALWGDWHYEATAFTSYDRSRVQQNDPNFGAIFGALNASTPATALNPFTTGAPGAPALLATMESINTLRFNSENVTGEASLHGTLITLPTGSVASVVGVEYDHSRIYTYASDSSISSAATTLSRNAYSLFTEERLPLIAGQKGANDTDRLSLSVAGRYDDTNDYGHKLTGQAGLVWHPIPSLLFRGGYGTSYEAPQLPQLSGTPSSYAAGGLVDPLRGNQAVNNVPVTSGPNPTLQPESGRSRSLGIVYSRTDDPTAQVSLTYWAIDIKNYINVPALQDLLSYPSLFPGAVVRGPPSPQDIQNGYAGPIIGLNDLYYNFGDLSVNGFDLDARCGIPTPAGRFTPSISVTDTNKYNSALSPSSPAVSYVGQANLDGFAPRWKGTVALSWERRSLAATVDGRYVGHYNDYLGNPFPYPHDIGNFWFVDGNIKLALGQAVAGANKWISGVSLQVGGVNLLNARPKPSYSFSGYDYQEADIRGRFLYAQLNWKW